MFSTYAQPPDKSTAKRRGRANAAEPSPPGWFRDLAFERDVVKLHRLGPRAVGQILRELGAESMHMTTIEAKVARYGDLDPDLVQALGDDRFAKPPLTLVRPDDEGPAP